MARSTARGGAAVVLLLALVVAGCGGNQAADEGPAPSEASARADAAGGSGADPWLKSAELNAAEVQQPDAVAGDAAGPLSNIVAKALTPVNVYRFYNRNSGAHFYTASATERDWVIASVPVLAYEGQAFQTSSTADSALRPVYRFFNGQTGVHFYTISQSERDHIIATLPQFTYEGVAYHASTAPGTGFRPLYRFYVANRGFHFFTTSSAEAGQVIATLPQYRYEGIAYYVLGQADPAPPSGVGYQGNPVPVPPDGAVGGHQPARSGDRERDARQLRRAGGGGWGVPSRCPSDPGSLGSGACRKRVLSLQP